MPFKGGGISTDAKRGGCVGGVGDERGVSRGGLQVGQHSARNVERGSALGVGGFKFLEASFKNERGGRGGLLLVDQNVNCSPLNLRFQCFMLVSPGDLRDITSAIMLSRVISQFDAFLVWAGKEK